MAFRTSNLHYNAKSCRFTSSLFAHSLFCRRADSSNCLNCCIVYGALSIPVSLKLVICHCLCSAQPMRWSAVGTRMNLILQEQFGGSCTVTKLGKGGGGCISQGEAYSIEGIGDVFVKQNHKHGAEEMFFGEYAGLLAIDRTHTVRVPKPLKVFDLPGGGAALVTEYLDMRHLNESAEQLGSDLARLHLHNYQKLQSGDGQLEAAVSNYGFEVTTCCGFLPQDNTWNASWPKFYRVSRLQPQIDRAITDNRNKELADKWKLLEPKMSSFFRGTDIFASLLHGDLWSGNAMETGNPAHPVVFDCAAAYGHHEFDLSISSMFGGFNRKFFAAYHKVLPKADGFDNRQKLYQLYHYLNHYNHFGGGYLQSSLRIMDELLRMDI